MSLARHIMEWIMDKSSAKADFLQPSRGLFCLGLAIFLLNSISVSYHLMVGDNIYSTRTSLEHYGVNEYSYFGNLETSIWILIPTTIYYIYRHFRFSKLDKELVKKYEELIQKNYD